MRSNQLLHILTIPQKTDISWFFFSLKDAFPKIFCFEDALFFYIRVISCIPNPKQKKKLRAISKPKSKIECNLLRDVAI